MHGYGKLSFLNGDHFEGMFHSNKKQGKGTYYLRQPNSEGILYFQGTYNNDKKNGFGKIKYETSEFYGIWKDGEFQHAYTSAHDWFSS